MEQRDTDTRAQIVYFSHGGGPLPILGDEGHGSMVEFLRALPARLRRPDAIVVISAHWEEASATLTGSPTPPMFYDYYGFPSEAYEITYPAPGDPELARRIVELLEKDGVAAGINEDRGYDHGLFIPLKLMFPEANVPSVQLSLLRGLDAAAHIHLGEAMRELRRENILIVGSGFSFHNLRAFSWHGENQSDPRNDAFQEWLIESCAGLNHEDEIKRRLLDWSSAPHARYCHPREEHLLPLHVCVGLAGKPAQLVFDDLIFGKRALAFMWS